MRSFFQSTPPADPASAGSPQASRTRPSAIVEATSYPYARAVGPRSRARPPSTHSTSYCFSQSRIDATACFNCKRWSATSARSISIVACRIPTLKRSESVGSSWSLRCSFETGVAAGACRRRRHRNRIPAHLAKGWKGAMLPTSTLSRCGCERWAPLHQHCVQRGGWKQTIQKGWLSASTLLRALDTRPDWPALGSYLLPHGSH